LDVGIVFGKFVKTAQYLLKTTEKKIQIRIKA